MAKGKATAIPPMSNHTAKHMFFLQSMFLLISWPDLELTHFFQGLPVEISGGHIGIWLRLLLRDCNSMLPTLPIWQAAHGFGSEQNKNSRSMALKVRLQL